MNNTKQKIRHCRDGIFALERIMGVEPTCSAWEADILPMNYIRIFLKLYSKTL